MRHRPIPLALGLALSAWVAVGCTEEEKLPARNPAAAASSSSAGVGGTGEAGAGGGSGANGGAGAREFLRVRSHLVPTSDKSAPPVLNAWNLQVTCVLSE